MRCRWIGPSSHFLRSYECTRHAHPLYRAKKEPILKNMKMIILAAAVITAIAMPLQALAQSAIEQAAARLLGDKFGIPVQQIFDLSRRSKQDVFELAPTYSIAKQSRHPANEVWRLREQGLGWGEIAHRLGMHPGTFNKMRKAGAFDREAIWGSIYRDRYGMSNADIDAIRRRGGSHGDILPSVIIATSSRMSPISVYDRYRKNGDWDRTAATYKVDLKNPGKSWGAKVKTSTGKEHCSNSARAKAHDAHDKVNSANGKGGGNGKGHGKGGG
jgi:hypothetical protein